MGDLQQIGFTVLLEILSVSSTSTWNSFRVVVRSGLWVCRIYHKKRETRLWVYLGVFIAIVFTHTQGHLTHISSSQYHSTAMDTN